MGCRAYQADPQHRRIQGLHANQGWIADNLGIKLLTVLDGIKQMGEGRVGRRIQTAQDAVLEI